MLRTRCLAILLMAAMPASGDVVDLFFAGGQSNATDRWADAIEDSLEASALYGEVEVVHINHFGQWLNAWVSHDSGAVNWAYRADFYRSGGSPGALQERIEAIEARGDTWRMSGFFWFQGEGDTGSPLHRATYADRFDRLLDCARALPGDTDCSGAIDTHDLTTAIQWFGKSRPIGFDVFDGDTDEDGDIDTNDLTTALQNYTGSTGTGKTPFEGDTDADGDVDTNDLTQILINFSGAGRGRYGNGLTQFEGDTDFDGDVDSADLAHIIANFSSAPGGTQAPPLPFAVALVDYDPEFIGQLTQTGRTPQDVEDMRHVLQGIADNSGGLGVAVDSRGYQRGDVWHLIPSEQERFGIAMAEAFLANRFPTQEISHARAAIPEPATMSVVLTALLLTRRKRW